MLEMIGPWLRAHPLFCFLWGCILGFIAGFSIARIIKQVFPCLFIICALVGCVEIDKIIVDTNKPIEDSGVYNAAIQITMADGTVYHIPDARFEVRVGGVEPPPPPCPFSAPLDINSATQEQLEKLAGIGPTYAERIIEYRTKNGNFEAIEDLMDVRGIGPKTFAKFSHCICVDTKWAVEDEDIRR